MFWIQLRNANVKIQENVPDTISQHSYQNCMKRGHTYEYIEKNGNANGTEEEWVLHHHTQSQPSTCFIVMEKLVHVSIGFLCCVLCMCLCVCVWHVARVFGFVVCNSTVVFFSLFLCVLSFATGTRVHGA